MSWFRKKEEDIEIGDIINFQDAHDPTIGHGHGVIGFDKNGNPLVECDDEIVAVKPEQIEKVYK